MSFPSQWSSPKSMVMSMKAMCPELGATLEYPLQLTRSLSLSIMITVHMSKTSSQVWHLKPVRERKSWTHERLALLRYLNINIIFITINIWHIKALLVKTWQHIMIIFKNWSCIHSGNQWILILSLITAARADSPPYAPGLPAHKGASPRELACWTYPARLLPHSGLADGWGES